MIFILLNLLRCVLWSEYGPFWCALHVTVRSICDLLSSDEVARGSPPPPFLCVVLIVPSSSWNWGSPVAHGTGVPHCLRFWDWLILFNVSPLGSLCSGVVRTRCFLRPNHFHWVCPPRCAVLSFTSGHLGCFHIPAPVNHAAVNTV